MSDICIIYVIFMLMAAFSVNLYGHSTSYSMLTPKSVYHADDVLKSPCIMVCLYVVIVV